MKCLLYFLSLALASDASAIVIRHDVTDARYQVPESELRSLVDLPHEGHGVLISPRWIVTAAHATQWHPLSEVMIDGKCRKVERVIVHPGYKLLPKAMQTGDAKAGTALLRLSDDIALIKLAEPLADVPTIELYRGRHESGKRVALYGKGATGNGVDGQHQPGSNRTVLRRAYSTISSTSDRWLGYRFRSGPSADPLEGMLGNGDSGGPVLMQVGGRWRLVGLASWKLVEGDIGTAKLGVYGQTSYQVRISSYAKWIDTVIAAEGK